MTFNFLRSYFKNNGVQFTKQTEQLLQRIYKLRLNCSRKKNIRKNDTKYNSIVLHNEKSILFC